MGVSLFFKIIIILLFLSLLRSLGLHSLVVYMVHDGSCYLNFSISVSTLTNTFIYYIKEKK